MIRLVNTPTQKVYGDFPLELPLIKMSKGEALWLGNEPQIYDENYPLNYSGLHFNTAWYEDTGVGGSFMGGLGDWSEGVAGGNVALHPADFQPGGYAYMNGLGSLGGKVPLRSKPQQRVPYWFGDQVEDPARLQFRMRGMGSLGLTLAQQKAQAAAQARTAAKSSGATPKQIAAAVTAARTSVVAAAKPAETVTSNVNPVTPTTSATSKLAKPTKATKSSAKANDATAQSACTSVGGVWNKAQQTCSYTKAQAACTKSKGTWDSTNNVCITPAQACATSGGTWNGSACISANQQGCVSSGGTWDPNSLTCAPGQRQNDCLASGGTFANGICTPNPAQQDCVNKGGSWANGICTPGTNPAQAQCAAQNGFWDGTTCQNPNTQFGPQQCQQQGGYWNGTSCVQNQQNQQNPPYTGTPQTSPIPAGFDSGGGGGGSPSPSVGTGQPQQQQGSGFPMTQDPNGQGGQFTDQANQFQMAPQGGYQPDQTADGSSSTDTDTDKDTTAGVASSNIFESISKMFTGGMNGTDCGLGAAAPWIGTGGPNVPPAAIVRSTTPPINSSTVAGTVGVSLLLILGSAAIFLWANGKKK